jgi:DNA-binding beta-propeller fold protein YncE
MNSRVQVFTTDAEVKLKVGGRGLYIGNFVRPKGVAVDDEGNLYVIESLYDHLLVYDPNGRFLLSIGGTGQGVGQFYLPAGVWVDNKNRVFVADMFNGRVVVLQFLGGG